MATLQFSVAMRNNFGEAYEATLNGQTINAGAGAGASISGTAAQPRCQLFTGSIPANCAAAATGTKLVDVQAPADWMAAASGGVKALAGAWSVAAVAAGTPGYYRMVDSTGACHEQGDVTAAGGGGAMTVDNTNIALGQTVVILTKTLTAPNA